MRFQVGIDFDVARPLDIGTVQLAQAELPACSSLQQQGPHMRLFRATADDPYLVIKITLGLRNRGAVDQSHQWSKQQIDQDDKTGSECRMRRMTGTCQ